MRLPILAVLFCAACAPARPGEPQYHARRADRAAALFRRAPALRVQVLSRLEAGSFVVLHERAAGTPDGRASDAVYTYEVPGGRVDATTADDLVAT
jgi:hypothetical protein